MTWLRFTINPILPTESTYLVSRPGAITGRVVGHWRLAHMHGMGTGCYQVAATYRDRGAEKFAALSAELHSPPIRVCIGDDESGVPLTLEHAGNLAKSVLHGIGSLSGGWLLRKRRAAETSIDSTCIHRTRLCQRYSSSGAQLRSGCLPKGDAYAMRGRGYQPRTFRRERRLRRVALRRKAVWREMVGNPRRQRRRAQCSLPDTTNGVRSYPMATARSLSEAKIARSIAGVRHSIHKYFLPGCPTIAQR